MADKCQALNESLMRLAAVPVQQVLTRDQWVAKFSRIILKSVVAVTPEAEDYSLDASWALLRVGSIWREDEEYHVYTMEHAIRSMIEMKNSRPEADMLIVTPIWVFRRFGSRAMPVGSEAVLRTAEQNFMRFFRELYKRSKSNG